MEDITAPGLYVQHAHKDVLFDGYASISKTFLWRRHNITEMFPACCLHLQNCSDIQYIIHSMGDIHFTLAKTRLISNGRFPLNT